MFNLSIQEVVLSIEKTPVIKEKHFVYQHYHNFFGNLQELELDIGNLNFYSLENQENYSRKRLSYNEKLSKQLHIFFMNRSITSALEEKFEMDLKFKSVDVWIDNKGYHLPPHTDNSSIKLALQIYLSNNSIGTSLYDLNKEKIHTFQFNINFGYALLNNKDSFHGADTVKEDGRISLYARYS